MAKKPVQPVRVERGAVKKMVEAAFAELGPQASLQDVKDYVKKKDSAMKEGSVQQAYYAAKGGSSGGGRKRGSVPAESIDYVKKKAGLKKPIKLLRKTSASELGEHPEYSQYVRHFLAQSPKGMADRHYVKPSDERFFEALAWLRKQYFE